MAQVKRYKEYDFGEEEDEFKPWEFDDISSTAHAELEQHREARHYARIAAYEMPRLSQLAKPFVPPTEQQVLRFRYTTYMGEQHPAESKVVLEFAPMDLPLEPIQTAKLIKLAGVRYNPEKKIVHMSCEMFEHQAQNKRYLSDLVDKLITSARDPTDTFEDVPFDFRHVKKQKPKPKFPHEWVQIAQKKEEERLQKKYVLE